MKNLDALIINPSALKEIYQDLSEEYSAIETPIWAGLIANNLRKNNFKIDILDCEGENLDLNMAISRISSYSSRLIILVVYGQQPSASTQNMHPTILLTKAIKKLNPMQKIILIGGHISALPKQSLLESGADFTCKGEGLDTLNYLLSKDIDDQDIIENTPGLFYLQNKKVVKSKVDSKIIPEEKLDLELPGVAYDLLPMNNYRAHNWHCFENIDERKPYASIYTSLGCPFRCEFCCINAPFGQSSFRHWTPKFIVNQIKLLRNEYNIKNIKIADEMFVLKESHYLEVCKLIIQEGLDDLNIWAYARIDTIKHKHLPTLKQAGINWLVLGIESMSKLVRDGANKGKFTNEKIIQTVRMVQKAGINVHANYIFGLPDDNLKSMNETLDLSIKINAEMANFYSAMAYPGSSLYQQALAKNLALPDTWLDYSQHSKNCLPLRNEHLSGGEILFFRDFAWNKYFTSENYLNQLKTKFGNKTYEHILNLSKKSLLRKNSISPF